MSQSDYNCAEEVSVNPELIIVSAKKGICDLLQQNLEQVAWDYFEI